MLRSLLVPLDGTRFSEYALPLAEGVAQATGAALHLAHVHVPHPPTALIGSTPFQFEGMNLDAYDDHDRDREKDYMAALAGRLTEAYPVPVDTALLEGEVPSALAQYAKEIRADAVVLSTHSRTGPKRAWMGSVAEGMIRSGSFPILVVHADEAADIGEPLDIQRILVALDGSELSETILAPAAELAQACEARLTLLHVLSTGQTEPGGMIPTNPDQWTHALEEGESYLEGLAGRLRRRRIPVDTVVMAHPEPGRAIREVAEEDRADLIAMASHGYTGIRRVLFGSVAEDVLRHCRVPMLIRRPT